MDESVPTRDMNIAEILQRWPQTRAVFQKLHTACVGCVMAPFDTIADVAFQYRLDEHELLRRIREAAQQQP
jgi:hybrid cluster-associated redox disulfide protein